MKKFLKRQWPLIGVGVLVALVAFHLIKSDEAWIKHPLVRGLISEGEGLSLKDIHYTQNDPAKGLKWILDAGEVKISEDKKTVFFQDFRMKLEPKNRPFIKLKGKRGNYFRGSGKINLKGNLEGNSENGYRIITEQMMVNEKSGQLNTDKLVKIFGSFFSIEGKGLLVDLEQEKLKVLSDVTTIVTEESLI